MNGKENSDLDELSERDWEKIIDDVSGHAPQTPMSYSRLLKKRMGQLLGKAWEVPGKPKEKSTFFNNWGITDVLITLFLLFMVSVLVLSIVQMSSDSEENSNPEDNSTAVSIESKTKNVWWYGGATVDYAWLESDNAIETSPRKSFSMVLYLRKCTEGTEIFMRCTNGSFFGNTLFMRFNEEKLFKVRTERRKTFIDGTPVISSLYLPDDGSEVIFLDFKVNSYFGTRTASEITTPSGFILKLKTKKKLTVELKTDKGAQQIRFSPKGLRWK